MAAALSSDAAASAPSQPLAFPDPPAPAPTGSDERVNVLLVDDDDDSLRALRHVLEPLGQNLIAARSGEQALRWLLREEFALILLDMRMPGLDGLQTARYINARARTRHIPIVFLTAHRGDADRLFGAYAAGAVDYVTKPFEPALLRSKVTVFVELHRARAQHVREARARAEAEGIASTIGRLQSISDAALAHLELHELIPELLSRARAVFEVEGAGIMLCDEQDSLVTLGPDGVGHPRGEEELAHAHDLLGAVLDGTRLAVGSLDANTVLPGALGSAGMRSLIGAPLSATGKLGVLFLTSTREHAFSQEDVVVLGLGAERAGAAIEHARSYERERGIVATLQDHLLPDRLPEVAGMAMAARYRPSERLAQVGGDWYDAIQLPGERLGLVIGDVVGHGIGAAALMAELRSALRAYALVTPDSPARTLQALNQLVAPTHRKMVATLLYVILDENGGGGRFASAGHLPPLVARDGGEVGYLRHRPASPLGVSEWTRYEDNNLQLRAGDTLLLYTDGLVERRGESIDRSIERLARVLHGAPAELERLCAHLLAHSDEYEGPRDDVAFVAVRRIAYVPGQLELSLPAEPRSVPTARHRLRSWLEHEGAPAESVGDILLAANEACTNAVEHAYGPGRDAVFLLAAEHTSDAIVIRVHDGGSWRNPRGTRGGRGLRVIEKVMDALEVRREQAGTTVEMRKELVNGG